MTNSDKAYAVIMAGGSGTRFWPLSRSDRPKQFLALGPDDRSLLRATAERVWDVLPPERTLVVTSEQLRERVERELPELRPEQILAEPVGRNTAPCIGWAATHVKRLDEDAIMAVLPADHFIGEKEAYADTLRRGLEAATHGDYVTIGIRPGRAETGYGYIEVGSELDPGVFRARRFVEKPNRQRAEQFVANGNFLWNSGMFFFLASRILEAIDQHLPGLGQELQRYDEAARAGTEAALVRQTYSELPAVSIDHGIMEKVSSVSVVPGTFEWSDLGSWTSAWELSPRDENANVLPEGAITVDASGNFVTAPDGKLVALIGVDNLVVVDAGDALLIVPRERAQEVREVVAALRERGDHTG
ncbi:MAG: NTP transferase domain-containing protein [Deltaproteobacteria bacterium]|nr:NTP transferase domain-containing protein [Deltaproteobacteria bacterium]NND29431.1 NTP transferase domain-containing protein [Myxococcales bacterium]MBT8463397.1 NTP transferase domain-containing protein [Deltaproteobacteria bacterium]MBT8480691.1 NTP transferase domain-containing protein [Deltaproteobacteria bacterium]NNK09134.1 NTP transferase domain-containing protein [Myxococcales bacterium]